MRRYLFSICVLAAIALGGAYSCKRTTGIDNNNVIVTPFSLYFSDTAGALYYTNDGRNYDGFVFPPDGRPCRALTTSVYNVLWAKNNLYYSQNNGKNFNHTYDTLSSFPTTLCDGQAMDLNQTMLLTVTKWNNRVYACANSDNPSNYLGLIVSDYFGNPKTWGYDAVFDTAGGMGAIPVRMTSLTFLANGTMCALGYSSPATGDNYHVRNFVKGAKDGTTEVAGRWKEVTSNPDGITYIWGGNPSGTPLPPYGTIVDTSYFILGHMNNRLIAIDARCNYGGMYSDDNGQNWKQYAGLPIGVPLLCINAPFEEVCLVGTAGKGVYILNQHTNSWEPSNRGLGSNTTVKSIAFKKNVYKNGTERKFIYLATNKGLYESADGGLNWVLTIPGNYVAVY